MAKIKINDLSKDMSISHEDMRKVHGGGILTQWPDDALTSLASMASSVLAMGMAAGSSSSSDSSSGAKPDRAQMQAKLKSTLG
jgi:hypothetical protein